MKSTLPTKHESRPDPNCLSGGKRKRVRLGDVFEIPLPNGQFAYGRIYDDAGIGIYNFLSERAKNPPLGFRDFMFNVGIYEDILKFQDWEIVGNDPFNGEESSFPPPSYILDPLTGEYSIYHKGQIRPASKTEARGLEETAVWDSHHIISRIMRCIDK